MNITFDLLRPGDMVILPGETPTGHPSIYQVHSTTDHFIHFTNGFSMTPPEVIRVEMNERLFFIAEEVIARGDNCPTCDAPWVAQSPTHSTLTHRLPCEFCTCREVLAAQQD